MPIITLPAGELFRFGLGGVESIHYQASPEELIHDCLRRGEGVLSDTGALVIQTGEFTGRSPKDRFIVKDAVTAKTIQWNDFNQPIDESCFDTVFKKITGYLGSRSEIWVRDCFVCADPRFRLNIRVINELASANLFAHNMFLRPTDDECEDFYPDWHILAAPGLHLDHKECGTRQHNAVLISFKRRMILIAGSGYTGEIKKAVFTILNFILPQQHQVLSMHCSANVGAKGDTAIFFGLSGTGKTTLSADPCRKLIGDDEHGWTGDNVFNFEGGCYAKCIHLHPEREPDIYQAVRPGALVENIAFHPGTNRINFDDGSITENTRVSYPLHYIANALEPSVASKPSHIFFLTCDAYGVLPPISLLTPAQAMYQFISGYTAKVAGTETGITEPKPTFSACFGAPFLPLHPGRYAALLGKKIAEEGVQVWLINTGWTGGPHGVGNRLPLTYTRAMISAVLEGYFDSALDADPFGSGNPAPVGTTPIPGFSPHPAFGKSAPVETPGNPGFSRHPVFGMSVPTSCPGVPAALLDPRSTWADKVAYDRMATDLAGWFRKNFEKYADGVTPDILAAQPS